MLINVSHLKNIHFKIESKLQIELSDIKSSIAVHYMKETSDALQEPNIKALYSAWQTIIEDQKKDPSSIDAECFTWEEIQHRLYESTQPIEIIIVNSESDSSLAYDQYKQGRSVIALGGYSLSRGLTLEGLSCSYIQRKTQQRDTLLQMGRWFGYRDGYFDLTRVWMDEDTLDRFATLARDEEELRDELRQMNVAGLTPRHFALSIRTHPGFLNVTSPSKARAAKKTKTYQKIAGQTLQTLTVRDEPGIRITNWKAMNDLFNSLSDDGWKLSKAYAYEIGNVKNSGKLNPEELLKHLNSRGPRPAGQWIHDVPHTYITTFLNEYRNHPANYKTNPSPLINYIERRIDTETGKWDILLATNISSGNDLSIDACDEKLYMRSREFSKYQGDGPKAESGYKLKTSGAWILDPHDMGFGLTAEQIVECSKMYADDQQKSYKAKGPASYQMKVRNKPVLIIQPTQLTNDDSTLDEHILWVIRMPETQFKETNTTFLEGTVAQEQNQQQEEIEQKLEESMLRVDLTEDGYYSEPAEDTEPEEDQ